MNLVSNVFILRLSKASSFEVRTSVALKFYDTAIFLVVQFKTTLAFIDSSRRRKITHRILLPNVFNLQKTINIYLYIDQSFIEVTILLENKIHCVANK